MFMTKDKKIVNVVTELSNRLEGFTNDEAAFYIVNFSRENTCTSEGVFLYEVYTIELTTVFKKENNSDKETMLLKEIIDRLNFNYNGVFFPILKAEYTEDNNWLVSCICKELITEDEKENN